MKRIFVLSVLFLMVCSGISFAKNDTTVLAKMKDGKVITMSDFERILGYYDEEKQKILTQNPQYKAAILQRLVQGMVISRIARERDFDKNPEIREQIDLLTNDLLSSKYILKEVIAKISVTEEDMRLFYKAHQEDFRTPEMVRARHILIRVDKSASEKEKEKAKEKAENIRKRVMAGEDLEKLASEYSDDNSSKTRGGDLGFLPKGKMGADFDKVAFSLKPGELSPVFETPYGFHIVRVEEKRESILEPFDRVKENVKERVLNDFKKTKVDEFVEGAMKDAGVELNLEPFLPVK